MNGCNRFAKAVGQKYGEAIGGQDGAHHIWCASNAGIGLPIAIWQLDDLGGMVLLEPMWRGRQVRIQQGAVFPHIFRVIAHMQAKVKPIKRWLTKTTQASRKAYFNPWRARQ